MRDYSWVAEVVDLWFYEDARSERKNYIAQYNKFYSQMGILWNVRILL